MALDAYLNLTGETQGEIKGSSQKRGHEDSIVVIGGSHEVLSPRDAASGLPSGRIRHEPFLIIKEIDRATPLLMNLLTQNENVSDFSLRFTRPSASGAEEQHYTIELNNAHVVNIRSEMLNNKYPENTSHEIREHVQFTYEQITWRWEDGGITGGDTVPGNGGSNGGGGGGDSGGGTEPGTGLLGGIRKLIRALLQAIRNILCKLFHCDGV